MMKGQKRAFIPNFLEIIDDLDSLDGLVVLDILDGLDVLEILGKQKNSFCISQKKSRLNFLKFSENFQSFSENFEKSREKLFAGCVETFLGEAHIVFLASALKNGTKYLEKFCCEGEKLYFCAAFPHGLWQAGDKDALSRAHRQHGNCECRVWTDKQHKTFKIKVLGNSSTKIKANKWQI